MSPPPPPPTTQSTNRPLRSNCILPSDRNGHSKSSSSKQINGTISDFELYDHSLLSEPINIGVKNVAQIAAVLAGGTDEVRDILQNETNIIYECRVCTNLFRSLANLVAHKRVFCKKHHCEQMRLYDPSWFTPEGLRAMKNGFTNTGFHLHENNNINNSSQSSENSSPVDTADEDSNDSLGPRLQYRSPSKNLIPTSQSPRANKPPPQEQARKRKNLEDLLSGLSKRKKESQTNSKQTNSNQTNSKQTNGNPSSQPIPSKQFYSNEASSSNPNPESQSKKSSSNPNNSRSSSRDSTTSSQSSPNARKLRGGNKLGTADYNQVREEVLGALVKLIPTANINDLANIELTPVQIEVHLKKELNQLYACYNYLFECPDCKQQSFYFTSAIRHLITKHQSSRAKGKWISFAYSRVNEANKKPGGGGGGGKHSPPVKPQSASKEEPSNQTSGIQNQENPSVNLRIVKVNMQYQAIPSTSRKSTESQELPPPPPPPASEPAPAQPQPQPQPQVQQPESSKSVAQLIQAPNEIQGAGGTNWILSEGPPENEDLNGAYFAELQLTVQLEINQYRADHPNEQHLPRHIFAPLNSSKRYLFQCVQCRERPTIRHYDNAVKHLQTGHGMAELDAKLYAFEKGRPNDGQVVGNKRGSVPNGTKPPRTSIVAVPLSSFVNPEPKPRIVQVAPSLMPQNQVVPNGTPSTSTLSSIPSSAAASTSSASNSASSSSTSTPLTHPTRAQPNAQANGTPANNSIPPEIITIDSDEDEVPPVVPNGTINGHPETTSTKEEPPLSRQEVSLATSSKLFTTFDQLTQAHSMGELELRNLCTIELSSSINAKVNQVAEWDALRCLKCPARKFQDKILLTAHIIMDHLGHSMFCCLLCRRYLAPSGQFIFNHLQQDHREVNHESTSTTQQQPSNGTGTIAKPASQAKNATLNGGGSSKSVPNGTHHRQHTTRHQRKLDQRQLRNRESLKNGQSPSRI